MEFTDLELIFQSEDDCKLMFKEYRESQGVTCSKCGSIKHYWYRSKWQWQCTVCNQSTTLKSGTLLKYSKLGFSVWLKAIYVLSHSKGQISATQMQRLLNLKRYESAWFLMHRLRIAFGQSLNQISMNDGITIDKSIFQFLLLSNNKGTTKSKKSIPNTSRVPVVFATILSKEWCQKKIITWPILALPSYNFQDELDEDELLIKTRRYYLKRLSRFKSAPDTEIASDHCFPSELNDYFNSLKIKLFKIHRGVTPRYVQKYLDEYIGCHYLAEIRNPFDWLLHAAVKAKW